MKPMVAMKAIPDVVKCVSQAAFVVGFPREEVKRFVHKTWPEMATVVTYGVLAVWKREIERKRA